MSHDLSMISGQIQKWVQETTNFYGCNYPGGSLYCMLRQNGTYFEGFVQECFGNMHYNAERYQKTGYPFYYAVIPYVRNLKPLNVLLDSRNHLDLFDGRYSNFRPLLDPLLDSPYREVIDFILKYDPWQIKPYLVCTDPQWIQENGWVFVDFKELPIDQVYGFSMFASRVMKGDQRVINIWRVYKEKMDPRKAMLLAWMCRPSDSARYAPLSLEMIEKTKHMPVSGPAWFEGLPCQYAYKFMSSQPQQVKGRGPNGAWSYRPRGSYIFSSGFLTGLDKHMMDTQILSKGGSFMEFSDYLDKCFTFQESKARNA